MSFITYLLKGPTSSLLNHLEYAHQLKNIGVTPHEDYRENIDVNQDSLTENSLSTSLYNVRAIFHIRNNNTTLLILDYRSLHETKKIWERFRSLSGLTRNIASLLTLGCLGCIYWKHLPGRSVFTTLIAVVAAAALACIARLAHSRTNVPWPKKFDKKINEMNSDIHKFRKEMLTLTHNPSAALNLILNGCHVLSNHVRALFTENEIIHLFTKIFFKNKSKSDFKTLYDFYVDREELTTDSDEARFVNAYAKFRSCIDFKKMKNVVPALFPLWFKTKIEPLINNVRSSLEEAQDEHSLESLDSFNEFFKKKMETDINPKGHECSKAFQQVCNRITSKLSSSPQEATEYLNTEAVEEFEKILFAFCFIEHLNDFTDKFIIFENLFGNLLERLPAETAKKIFLEDLPSDLDSDNDSTNSSDDPLNQNTSDFDNDMTRKNLFETVQTALLGGLEFPNLDDFDSLNNSVSDDEKLSSSTVIIKPDENQ